MASNIISSFLSQWFGDFTKKELFKFIKLGIIFCLIIGIYWSLRALKDSIFQEMVGAEYQPYAKMISLFLLLPVVMIYSKLVDNFSRKQVFYILSIIYGVATILFSLIMIWNGIGVKVITPSLWNIIAWVWYVFVESFGSIVVALFWAFATEITPPESGKRGFSLVVMIGQIGGMLIPLLSLTYIMGEWKLLNSGTIIMLFGVAIFLIIPLVWYFLKTTPSELLTGFSPSTKAILDKDEAANALSKGLEDKKDKQNTGFMQGLKLVIYNPYLLSIFFIIFFYETIATVIEYHFKLMTKAQIPNVNLRTIYLSEYGIYANLGTFLCLLFGINNITRRLGVTTALSAVPIFVAIAVAIFKFHSSLSALFWIMVCAKALNYALNGPAMKQLYIPLTDEARYKSQAWIETFGSRGSKGIGSTISALHKPLVIKVNGVGWTNFDKVRKLFYGATDLGSSWHIAITSYLFFGICGLWFFLALYLGRSYQKAVDKNEVVC